MSLKFRTNLFDAMSFSLYRLNKSLFVAIPRFTTSASTWQGFKNQIANWYGAWQQGKTALSFAAEDGYQRKVLELLLEHKAEVSAADKVTSTHPNDWGSNHDKIY
jgi:hypothetical protein